MSILGRARARAEEIDAAAADRRNDWIKAGAEGAANAANRMLELTGEDALRCGDMKLLAGDGSDSRNLYSFTIDGIEFACGLFWHGNPGDSVVLAVRTGRVTRPYWPPEGRSSDPDWSPRGYRKIYGLADLARGKTWPAGGSTTFRSPLFIGEGWL